MGICATMERWSWTIQGQVQGVGFRPFVHRLAGQCGLSGLVYNNPMGVHIEVQGRVAQLALFAQALQTQRPPLALFQHVERRTLAIIHGESEFCIQPSRGDQHAAAVTVDTAVCDDCLAEMRSPADRRHRYALINCTNCGPRYSIIRGVPYDRPNTTMARFAMCDDCRAEYTDPADRRFHAQPIACHACGPTLQLVDPTGASIAGDPVRLASNMLIDGRIVAIKGLGGFHLACRADHGAAVTRLRQLKHRDAKPFAVMVRDIAEARRRVNLSDAAARLMQSPACPIVLAPHRAGSDIVGDVAPANHRLGVMLPYTPMHHGLFDTVDLHRVPLVMTSGNVSDEPLVIANPEAIHRLGGMCDALLWHDRPIERCVDDAVVIDMGESDPLPVRRARGFVPMGVPLVHASGADVPDGLCVGGELKNTVAVFRRGQVIPSHHLGDLTHTLAFDAFKRTIDDMRDLFGVEPRWIAHDLHPLYLSTAHARALAAQWGVPLIGVQHHHAHAAALMAEHGIREPVLAIVCDGVGYGTDRTIWGGELLHCSLEEFTRLAHVRPLHLPGGDAAAKDTRRCGLALLHQAYGEAMIELPATRRLVPDPDERQMLCTMLKRDVKCAISTGVGRYYDGMAALLDVVHYNDFEARAGIALEALAALRDDEIKSDPLFTITDSGASPGARELDLAPLTRHIVEQVERGAEKPVLARLLHEQWAMAWAAATLEAARRTGLDTVAITGGVMCNQRLSESLTHRLTASGLRVLRHRIVPPNDAGLSLGQAAVAVARLPHQPTPTRQEHTTCV